MGKRESVPNATVDASFSNVTVCCAFSAKFIVGHFFFEEIGPSGLVTCTVRGKLYESLLRNQLIRALQQRRCVDGTIFMQADAPPHITTPVKQLLNLHFGNDKILSRISQQPGHHNHLT
ncbi:hypothetical protein AVEN_36271-1 [Araneus ventricosus]|uniref:Tc1-like transposase DDE domain-containing protein n=1 Tax=Araneus ventricosus TaxID=182803 RepID=A0A4Y2QW98_ARAVE|nr:hypothetical protein AVEN_36271-1 [Araneus ventricosus]